MSNAQQPVTVDCSIRHYCGEHAAHVHQGHTQLLYALTGRMELEVEGRASFVDTACGLLIPAGCRHGYLAPPGAQMLVLDVAASTYPALDKVRRFQVPAAARCMPHQLHPEARLQLLLQSPLLLSRRSVDVQAIERQVRTELHAPWPTARLAALTHLSAQRFHARWHELTGATPQQWLRSLRLDEAQRQLARGRNLQSCATACGYASASALAYALRRDRSTGARQLRKP
ncbi:AraC family transcriptional regulator [Comamonas sp.]|uniref:helix-turn-helix domain-containing protein n=1 Tax=Comamonas sp. TaxID=34028 RepID=UPI00258F1D1B|nr:AraC family transcriptional regulator [Comamonas sp.]